MAAMAVVGLVAGTLVVADRITARVAAGRIADALACVVGLPAPPQVTVHGFPFVSQVLTGRFTGLTVRTDQLGWGGLPIAELAAEIRDIDIDGDLLRGDLHDARIGRLHASVTIDPARLTELLGDRLPAAGSADGPAADPDGPAAGSAADLLAGADLRIRGSDAGQLVVEATAAMFGQSLPLTLYAVPVLEGRTLRIEPVEVEVFGIRRSTDQLPGALGDRRIERELPELPAGLVYHDLSVTADGLRLDITGESIALDGEGLRSAGSTPRPEGRTCTPSSR